MSGTIRKNVADDVRVERADLGTVRTVMGAMEIKTDDYTVTAEDSGKTFGMGTDGKTFTLPATAAGLEYRFVNTGAAANNNLRIDPDDDDAIYGTVMDSGGTAFGASGTDGNYIENAKAAAEKGAYIELTGDGSDGWYITGGLGTFSEES